MPFATTVTHFDNCHPQFRRQLRTSATKFALRLTFEPSTRTPSAGGSPRSRKSCISLTFDARSRQRVPQGYHLNLHFPSRLTRTILTEFTGATQNSHFASCLSSRRSISAEGSPRTTQIRLAFERSTRTISAWGSPAQHGRRILLHIDSTHTISAAGSSSPTTIRIYCHSFAHPTRTISAEGRVS